MSDVVTLVLSVGDHPSLLWIKYKLNNGYKSPSEALKEAMTVLFDYAVAKDIIDPTNPNIRFHAPLNGTEPESATREPSSE